MSLEDILVPQLWADNLRANVGPEKTLEALKAWNDAHPIDGVAKIALLREYQIQLAAANQELAAATPPAPEEGAEPVEPTPEETEKIEGLKAQVATLQQDVDSTSKEMSAYFATLDHTYRFDDFTKATLKINYSLFSGDIEAAESLLSEVSGKQSAELSLTRANLFAMKGDAEGADKALTRAATLAPSNAGYALFLR